MAVSRFTRVRVEATCEEAADLVLTLAEFAENIRSLYGGEWEEEEPGIVTQSTKGGFWGRYTLRRKVGT